LPVADTIDLTVTNVKALTIDVARAHVDCNVKLNVTSDGPVAVTLAGCGFAAATSAPRPGLPNTSVAFPESWLLPGWVLVALTVLRLMGARRSRDAE
jgi:hypothetical protein